MKEKIVRFLEDEKEALYEVSDYIWDNPEIAFHEYKAAEKLISLLEKEGFGIERNLAGIPTAFKAVYKQGGPVIGILGEFDALDGMSQENGVYEKKEIDGQIYGHGCGHHAIGSAAAFSAIALKKYLEETQRPGTVIFFGCPGEEGGSGKSFMVRDGIFEGVDCALTWHPSDQTGLFTGKCLANIGVTYRFFGISAHAGGLAYLGRSALDAVELMNVGANYLREHIVPNARIHYAIIDAGGTSPNVVQSHAAVYYYLRAPEAYQVKEMYNRMADIAKGAALMTGTEVKVEYNRGVNSLMPNTCMDHILHRNMTMLSLPEYTGKDYECAEKIRNTIGAKDETFNELLGHMDRTEKKEVLPYKGRPIYDFITPEISTEPLLFGSTDVGDVSMICPVSQIHAATYAAGTSLHSWQAVAQGKSSLLHKGELYAAKVLACSAIDLFENPGIINEAKEELKGRLGEHPFESLMPEDIKPQLNRQ